MTYDDMLAVLAQFNLIAWIIATVVSFIVLLYTKTRAWLLVMVGSAFVVLRQLAKFMPGYEQAQASEALFNAYMIRYLAGSVGAILLSIGLVMLIVNYHVVRSRLDEEF